MSALRTLILLSFALCIPAVASAVTVHDIIELTRAGLPDDVLVAVIEADRTVFTLDKDQILELKKAGVSKAVLLKMIRSRREFDVPAVTDTPAATTTSTDSPQPGVVVIGVESKPEPEPPAPQYFYYSPFPIWGARVPRGPRLPQQPFMPGDRTFGRFINDGWIGPPK